MGNQGMSIVIFILLLQNKGMRKAISIELFTELTQLDYLELVIIKRA